LHFHFYIELKYKTFEEFALPNLPENIQTLRFNQAESGRQLLWGKVKEEVARIQHEAELYPESGVVTRRTRRKTGSNENQVKIQKIRKTARENARALQDDWTGKFERNIEALMMHHDDEMNTLALSAVHREQAKTKLRTREIRRAAKLVEKEKALQEQAKTRKAYRHKTYERVMKKEAKDRKKFRDIVKRKEIRTEKQMKTLKKEWESKHFVGYRSRQAVEDNSAELEAELVRKEQAAAIRVRQEKEKKERLNLMRIRPSRERNETAQERDLEEQAKLKK
jgi:hypothetical protein